MRAPMRPTARGDCGQVEGVPGQEPDVQEGHRRQANERQIAGNGQGSCGGTFLCQPLRELQDRRRNNEGNGEPAKKPKELFARHARHPPHPGTIFIG
jgi:hypothetical protein